MRIIGKIIKWPFALIVLAIARFSAWFYFVLPALIGVSGYATKVVCSSVFIAGHDAGQVLANDV